MTAKRITRTTTFLAAFLLLAACTKSRDQAHAGDMANRVKTEFLHAWNNYDHYAWGHDALKPLTKTPHDWYGQSLLMTPIDALDTLVLMKLDAEADKARTLITTQLSLDRDVYVKNFEITIRLLGGLLSGYQLTNDKRLLTLAEDLGNRLLPAFESRTGLPYVYVNLHTGQVRDPLSNPAETGTLLLEFGTLSKLTGNRSSTTKPSARWSKLTNDALRLGSSVPASTSRPARGSILKATSAAASIPTTNIFGNAGSCSGTRSASRCGPRAFPRSINISLMKCAANSGTVPRT